MCRLCTYYHQPSVFHLTRLIFLRGRACSLSKMNVHLAWWIKYSCVQFIHPSMFKQKFLYFFLFSISDDLVFKVNTTSTYPLGYANIHFAKSTVSTPFSKATLKKQQQPIGNSMSSICQLNHLFII